MAIEHAGGWTRSIIARARTLFTRPREAWPEIDRDMTPSGELFTRYAAPLAALAPICGFIAGRVSGWNPFGVHIVGQLFTAVSGYAFSLVNLLIMSFVASKLAPRFGGEGSPRDAFKLIVYSSTAAWLASAAAMIPGLGFLGLAGLYSLYLFFTGIEPIMKVPEVNKTRFGMQVIVCAILLNLVTGFISNGPAWMLGGAHAPAAAQPNAVHINADPVAFDKIGQEIRDAIRKGNVKATPAADLQALLPASVGDFKRTGTESATAGPGSHAEATYEKGDQEFTLKIVDLAGFGAVARFGAAFPIQKDRQDEDGFEHVSNKDGALTVEKWDNDDKEGDYTTMVGKRYLIEAKGDADSFDELKQAVTAIDANKLTTLAK